MELSDGFESGGMLRGKVGKAVADLIQDKDSDDPRRAKITQDFEGLSLYNKNRLVDGRNGEISEMKGFRRAQIMDVEGMRYTNSIFSDEDPSNSLSWSSYEYENQVKNRNGMDGFNNADYVSEDRLELLKKFNSFES